MPLQATSGAASYDAFGGGVAVVPNYIEDVFSTYLYTGNGSTQTITNGIDLAGKGGLVWTKSRSSGFSHALTDTVRGAGNGLISNSTAAQGTSDVSSFTSSGFGLTFVDNSGNRNDQPYVSWTFREQPKFFDVVTYTGNGAGQGARAVPHNLQSTPGCIIIKRTDSTSAWAVWHRFAGVTNEDLSGISLNSTAAAIGYPNGTTALMNAASFDPANIYGADAVACNANGATYVAYLFAHNAGGFGLTGTDNVISCGSFTTDGSGNFSVNLGYEPQWLMFKRTDSTSNWVMIDNMRGWTAAGDEQRLLANTSGAETTAANYESLTATGFQSLTNSYAAGSTYIYIAIRRGPMRTPTTGTSVFQPLTRNGTGGATTVTSTVRPDTVLQNWRDGGLGSASHFMYDRLRGVARALFTDTTGAESTQTATGINAFNNLSYGIAGAGSMNNGSALYADYVFTRAPGFFDEVCYSGTGVAKTETHNLQTVPELMIVKSRAGTGRDWAVYTSATAATNFMYLNATDASGASSSMWNDTSPTSSVFTVGTNIRTNNSGQTYVAYLFATCAGVSKVGSYTGTGTTLQVNCGFTSGSRFVLIKRTDSTGDWYVWDSARGIVAGNDPYLLLNSSAAEVTNTDFIDTASTGFEISSTAPAAINASGGTYIFLAIA